VTKILENHRNIIFYITVFKQPFFCIIFLSASQFGQNSVKKKKDIQKDILK